MTDYTQLGIAGLTLAILFFVVKYFISALKDSNKERLEIVKSFNETINNHITMRNEQAKKETEALSALTSAIEKLPGGIVEGIKSIYPPETYKEGGKAYRKILKKKK